MADRSGPVPILALVLLILVAGSLPATAQEDIPVQIKADLFRYDRRTRVLTATGNVQLTFQDVRIRADALVANLETGEVTAEGNVLLTVGTSSVAADLLTYNLHTRFGSLANARTDYTGPLVLGAVHLRAQRLEGIPDEFATIRGGFLTTCDEQDPVVHLTADEVTVYLNDRIVGRRVSLWIAGRKVFTWPYFQIFLRERRQSRLTPVVGYTEAEGLFVKTTYSYVVNERHYGFLYGDWMERLGVGLGIEHLYRLGSGQGSAFLYRMANRQTSGSDLRAVFSHTQRISPALSAFLYADYFQNDIPGLTTSNLFGALDLAYTTPRSSTYLFAMMSTSSPGRASFVSGLLAHGQTLGPGLFGQIFLNLTRFTGSLGSNDEAFPRLALSYYGSGFSAALVAETRWDLDGDRFPFDAQYTLERLPELTFAVAAQRLGGTPLLLQMQGGLARFRETTVDLGGGIEMLDAGRADATLTVSGPIPLGGGTLGIRSFLRGSWYTTGALRLFYGGRVDYTQRLGSGFTLRAGYTGQGVVGTSPFVFDQTGSPFSFADAQVAYQGTNLLVQADGYYDFLTRQFGNIVAQAVYLPRPGWAIGLAGSYNLQLGQLDRAEAVLDLRLSKEWQVQYVGAYEGASGRLVHDRVTVTRIFCDCLAVSLTYLGARGEIWLEGWLTAIPWTRGKIGIGQRGDLLFDLPPPIPR